MAGFNVSFLNPKLRQSTGQDYGFLVDQLSILENRLAGDGKLASGDYDLLIDRANEIRSFPGLNPQQRSNIDVKVSDYEQRKSVDTLKDTGDLDRLNRELDDDFRTQGILFGNNPQVLLQTRGDATRLALDRLTETINNLEQAGDDATGHINEFNQMVNDYNDILQAREEAKKYPGEGAPESGFIAYVTTNDNGEVVDLDFGRVGSKTGYVETNGVYGGLQVYGKINKKQGGKNIFVMGDSTFEAADILIPDPQNPLAFRSNPLVSSKTLQRGPLGSRAVKGQFDVIDSTTIRTQSSVPTGHYAQGQGGFLYESLGNGKYRKYVTADQKQLGIRDNQILRVPTSFEENIARGVVETVDALEQFKPQAPTFVPAAGATGIAPTPTGVTPTPQPAPAPEARGRGRTGAPIPSAPAGIKETFQRTVRGARGILGRIFGQ